MRWTQSDYAGWSEVNAAQFERSTSATKSPPLQIRRHRMSPSPCYLPVPNDHSCCSDGGSREPNRDGRRCEVATMLVSIAPRARSFPAHTVRSVLLAG